MKKRIILHIGTHKTGTTALQKVFAAGRETLAQVGICYPDTTREPHPEHPKHSSLFFAAVHDPRNFPREIALMQREADEAGCNTLLISAEGFSEPFYEKFKVFSTLKRDYDLDVFCTLRRQDQFLESLWNQIIKQGNAPGTIEAFCKSPRARLRGDYVRLLDFWAEIGKVHVADYDAARGAGIVSHFTTLAGLPQLPEAVQSNSSLGMNNAVVRSWYNSAKIKAPRPLLEAMEGDLRRLALGSQLRRELLAEFAPVNAVLAKRYGIVFSDKMPEEPDALPLLSPDPSFLLPLLTYLADGQPALRVDHEDLRMAASQLRRTRPDVAMRLAETGLAMRPNSQALKDLVAKLVKEQDVQADAQPAAAGGAG